MQYDHGARRYRLLRFEPFEARIMMSISPNDPTPEYLPEALLVSPPTYNSTALSVFEQVRQVYGLTGVGQTVAIIDTGIAYSHTSLGGGYGPGYRVVGGWDFAENDANPYDDGPAGAHGTHVAGIVGSTHGTHTGAATDVDLVALRVFDDAGNGSFAWIEQALRWVYNNRNAFENPITTVNLSIGSNWNSSSIPPWAMLEDEFAQLANAGIFVSVAAGNSFFTYGTTGLSYPAASSYVVPVASVDANGLLSTFSQRDSRVIAAPGRNITSTVPDYLGNRNGIDDDFQAFSGTSMAAPFVAGASVLLRQAMEFAGVAFVNQGMLYEIMRNTADVIYDNATSQYYTRLNVMRALDAVMPADDYGSSLATAAQLGTVIDTLALNGSIARLDDRDCFAFTADRNGTVTISLDATYQLDPTWRLYSGSQLLTSGSERTWTFEVRAGETYTFDLGTSAGIGHYSLNLALEAKENDWGTFDFAQLFGLAVHGEQEFTLRATRDGMLTIEAAFDANLGAVAFDVYRADGQLVGSATNSPAGLRLDVTATAGQSYIVRVQGDHSTIDFRLTNLLQVSGKTATLFGTHGNDNVAVTAGSTFVVIVNGVQYQLDASLVSEIVIAGGNGIDSIQFVGSAETEHATLTVGSATIQSSQYRLTASGFENIDIHSGGGTDTATLYDSAGQDRLVVSPDYAHLTGAGFSNRVAGFQQVTVHASAGDDVALVYGSAGNDTLVARPRDVRLSGAGFDNALLGFRSVEVHTFGGHDTATIYDSAGDDYVFGSQAHIDMATSLSGLSAWGLENIRLMASTGYDTATLTGSAGNDLLLSTPSASVLRAGAVTYSLYDFDRVHIDGAGGNDQALFAGGSSPGILTARPGEANFAGAGFNTTVTGFQRISGYSSNGLDRAIFYDSAGDDIFDARSDSARLSGQGFDFVAKGFSSVTAVASTGNDVALLATGTGSNQLTLQKNSARLSRLGAEQTATGFGRVVLDATRGQLSSQQLDALDYVYEQTGG